MPVRTGERADRPAPLPHPHPPHTHPAEAVLAGDAAAARAVETEHRAGAAALPRRSSTWAAHSRRPRRR
ncbi:hypothetical protein [Streptomyces alkaliterrae]|uniref:Uncharacterized protein n=2 Tax=Streptomyces alkaliterrae TaxID=2213162 RepID=A0A7W3ZVS2_9ACTN|nr:hypothetical protein [Streptomyces alkaliterrae]MBB1262152.1 hypothetical protein [Streptomyces alkaliterrae]